MELSVTLSWRRPAPMSAVLPPRFVDPRPAARAAMGVLGVGVILDAHRFLFVLAFRESPELMTGLPNQSLHVLVRLATAILFVMWIDRVWSNMIALGGRPEHSRIAVIYSFFVPPLCFFRPVQIVNDVWQATAYAPARQRTLLDRWMPRLVVIWWIVFLAPPALVLTGIGASSVDKWRRIAAGEALNTVAGVLAIAIVSLISARQHQVRLVLRQSRGETRESALTPAPVNRPSMVAEELPAAHRVPIAPSVRLVSPPHGVTAQPLQRLIRSQHVRRPSITQAFEAISPRVWQLALVVVGTLTAAALAGSAALLIRDPRNLAMALLQLGFASMVAAATFTIAREEPGDKGPRLTLPAMAAASIAIVQLFAIAEGLG